MSIDKGETEQHGSAKDQRGSDQSGQKLPCYQQLTPHGREEIIMQAFLHDLTAEQPGEQAHAAKENPDAQIKYLERVGQHARVFFNAAIASHGAGKRVNAEHYSWSKCQQVDPYAAAHPERLFDLNAQQSRQLRGPQLPRQVR